MAVRPIVIYPDPVLTTPAEPVRAFDEELRRLVDDMVATMRAHHGIGLAANQIGVLQRVTVVDVSGGDEDGRLLVLVNPEILSAEGRQTGEEGCLSFPGLYEIVARPERIRFRAQDATGRSFEAEAEGLLARAVCHEVDHLDGILFLRRMSPLKRRLALKRIERLKRQGEWPERPPAGSASGAR